MSVPWLDDFLAGASALGMDKGLYSFNPWDVVTMGEVKFPGVSTVSVTRSKRLDNKKAPGRDGATPTYLGDDPAAIDITCTIWTRAQWDALQDVLAILWPSSRGSKNAADYNQAIPLSHPALDCAPRIEFVVLTSIGKPRLAERGKVQVTLRGLEYIPPSQKNATKTPTKAPAPKPANVAVNSSFGVLQPVNNEFGGSIVVRSQNAAQPSPSTDTDFLGPLY